MKQQVKKNRIIIPDLIKKIRPLSQNKENLHPNQSKDIYQSFKPLHQPKLKISQFLNQSSQVHPPHLATRQEQKKVFEVRTSQSTDRTIVQSNQDLGIQNNTTHPSNQLIKQPINKQLVKLEVLLKSDRMFVNPDKWAQFMSRAVKDEKFHKALNIFLYSYFIQNYN